MKGIFVKRNRVVSSFVAAFFVIVGTFIAIRFGIWGIDALSSSTLAEAIFCFGFALIGICFGCMSILIFSFNRKAYLESDGKSVRILCGFGKRYDLRMDEITEASLIGKHLLIVTETERITVSNLDNAREVCEYLIEFASIRKRSYSFINEARSYAELKKKMIVRLIPTILLTVLLFVHIGWCVALTDGKDLSEFNTRDDIVFAAFAAAELITFSAALLFARICGRVNVMREETRKRRDIAHAQMHLKDSLEGYSGLIEVKYFDGGMYRIVIYSTNEEKCAYMLEHFNCEGSNWNICYADPREFPTKSKLYADIAETFFDVILENYQ
jgi:hypothetical protein